MVFRRFGSGTPVSSREKELRSQVETVTGLEPVGGSIGGLVGGGLGLLAGPLAPVVSPLAAGAGTLIGDLLAKYIGGSFNNAATEEANALQLAREKPLLEAQGRQKALDELLGRYKTFL